MSSDEENIPTPHFGRKTRPNLGRGSNLHGSLRKRFLGDRLQKRWSSQGSVLIGDHLAGTMSQIDLSQLQSRLKAIFASKNADEKFENFLAEGGRAKLNILSKAIELVGMNTTDIQDNSEERNKRAVIVLKSVLRLINRSYQSNSEEINDVTCCLLNGATNFSTVSLTEVAVYCLEYMRSHEDSDIPTLWTEVFGHVVSILTARKDVEYDGDTLTGKEFRVAMVNQLCRLNWGSCNTSYIISAIREIPEIDLAEIDNVIYKAFQAIKSLDPVCVPPIAFQLLLLAADKRPELLLQNFDDYFQGILLKEVEHTLSQPVNASQLKRKALGTVVYHFIYSARHTSALIREIVKRIKHSRVDHTLIMTPFMLSVSLGLTCIEHFKPQVVEALRRSIVNSLTDVRNCQINAWYRNARGEVKESFMDCFKSVIDSKSSELDFMLDGLRDLALALLNAEDVPSEHPCSLDKCQSLGSYIINAMVTKHNDYFPKVVDELLKNKKSLVHINCLAGCLRSMIRKIVQMKAPDRISELINHLPLMTVETSTPIVKALIPSFQLSRKLLSELIVVLRKTVYKSTEARKISAQAMILLLSNSRIIGAIPRSQYSESQNIFSQATQTQVDILGTARENESLCFEVLWILKRFFTQPSEVREQLYLGLHVVSRKNPELIKVICSHLVSQVHIHMNDERTEIKWSGLLNCSDPDEIIATEHLGYLLQCVSFVTLRGRRIYRHYSDDEPESLSDCEILLETWIQLLSRISKEDLELAASSLSGSTGALLPLTTVKDIRNALILQILQTLEALIEYIALKSTGRGSYDIQSLFRKVMELEPWLAPPRQNSSKKDKDKGKPPTKKKKGTGKSAATSSQGGGDSQNDKKKLKPEGPKSVTFIHIMNLESILEILKRLSGVNSDALNLAHLQKPFEKYILGVIKQKIDRLKKNENIGERERKAEEVVTTIASIAGALWESCRKRVDSSSDESMAVDGNDNGDEEIQVINSNSSSLNSFRFQILLNLVEFLVEQNVVPFETVLRLFNFEVYDDKSFKDMFEDFFEIWASFVVQCTEPGGNSKCLEFLFAILENFGKSLSPVDSEPAKKAIDWCISFVKTPRPEVTPTIEICGEIMKAILTIGSKLEGYPEKEFLKLARYAHCILGDVDEELVDPDNDQPWLITKDSAPVVICSVGLYVEENLAFVTGILQRLKVQSLYYRTDKLEHLRDKVCMMLTFLITLSTELIRTSFPPGPCVDILQRVMDQAFITTTLLTEHLLELHSKNKMDFTARKFANLVKLIGTDFKLRVEALINHIEAIQRDKAEELIKAKKGGRVPAAMRQKFMKDAKTIPALIYHVEKYEQQLYALGQKAKVNLLAGTKLSTARDFRIEVKELKEALADTKDKKKKNKSARDATPDLTSNETNNHSDLQQSGLSQINEESNASSCSASRGMLKRKRN
ncbi:unnamed protein product [Allacma fusca]|uniref:Fanconi anemia group I protein n=1 Tax=Allacma fusca TaxID=39272 RepID=A0A8J2L4G5_9HEXA|nr:unnamed protein product [Allacma fusca]